jgi:two-component system, NarL family, nitrate/nitrite response regulator NarL
VNVNGRERAGDQHPIVAFMIGNCKLFAEALKSSIHINSGLALVGWAPSVEEAAEQTRDERIDLLLINTSWSLEETILTVNEARGRFRSARLIVFGVSLSEESILRLIESGAGSYLSADCSVEQLLSTCRAVCRGEVSYSPKLLALAITRMRELSKSDQSSSSSLLSEREREVIHLISQGLGNKDIARRLGVSTSTVKNHVHKLLRKLNARRRRDAILKAYEADILNGSLPYQLPSGSGNGF